MRLTTKGRFAVTAMIDLALRQAGGPVTLAAISQRQQISLSYLEQLFGKLRRHDLVESTRGPGGGYTLGRKASDITVADIITAMEGPIALTACVDGAVGSCDVEALCAMRGNWDKVNRAIRAALSAVTLQEMLSTPSAFEMFPPLAARRDDVRAQ